MFSEELPAEPVKRRALLQRRFRRPEPRSLNRPFQRYQNRLKRRRLLQGFLRAGLVVRGLGGAMKTAATPVTSIRSSVSRSYHSSSEKELTGKDLEYEVAKSSQYSRYRFEAVACRMQRKARRIGKRSRALSS
jgi:hypothetical protein